MGRNSPPFGRRSFLVKSGLVLGSSTLLATASANPGSGGHKRAGKPQGIHVSYTDDPTTTATIVWFTDGLQDPGTNAEFGATRSLNDATTGESTIAPFGRTRIHEITLTGLDPGQRVYYRVGGASGYSTRRSLTTATEDGGFTFTMYGDQGVTPHARAVTDATIAADPDLHLIAGDTSYAEGDPAIWDAYFEQQEPLFSTVATMAVVGNHEYDAPGPGARGFEARWAMPGNEYWYSFDYQNVHFVCVDANGETITEGKAGDELTWLERDLAQAQAARAAGDIDWIIVIQHQPLYSSEDSRRNNVLAIAALEPMYQRYGVDVLLAGHNHMYERSLPMVGGTPTNDQQRYSREQIGFMQVVNGAGGNGLYEFRPEYAFQAWSARHALTYATTVFDVDEERIQGKAIEAKTGDILDEFVIMAGQT